MPTPKQSVEQVITAYQHFLSLLANKDLGGARGGMFEAIKAARQLDRPGLVAVLLLKLGHFYLDREADLQNAAHAFAAGINLLQHSDTGEDLKKALQPISRMEKGYQGSRGSLPDGYQPETEEDLLRAERDPHLAVKLLVSAGNCLLELGQDEAALKSFETALGLPSLEKEEIFRAQILTNMAEIHRRNERLEPAESLLLQAQSIFQTHPEADAKEYLAIFASLRSDQQDWEAAAGLFEQAVALYEQGEDDKGYSRTLIRLSALYLEHREFARARHYLEVALELGEQAGDKSNLAFVYQGLARCFLEEDDFRSAIPPLEQCFRTLDTFVEKAIQTEQGKLSRIAGMQWALNALIDCYLKWREQDDRPQDIEGLILKKIDQLHGLILDDLIGGTAKPFQKQEAIDLSDALGLGDQNPIRQTVTADYIFPMERTIEHPRRQTVLPLPRLVYHLTNEQLIIAYDRPGEKPIIINHPIAKADLRTSVAQLIRSLGVDNQLRGATTRGQGLDAEGESRADIPALLKEWYDLLVRPLAAFLPEPDSILVIEPHDALHLLPFAMLSSGPDQFLCDQYAVLVSPSQDTMNTIRTYQPYQSDLAAARALIVGNPAIESDMVIHGKAIGQMAALPGAEAEAALIRKLFDQGKVTYLTQSEASEAAIKAAIRNSNIIHLATHGLAFEEDPMASLLVVAGDKGFVTARTIREWEMPADLVVLSACQTALGQLAETEGVIGLTRSFFLAGARTLVVSLWSVDDTATERLMGYFYESLFAGDAVPFALRKAQLKLKSQAKYADPFYWAGFITIGAEG